MSILVKILATADWLFQEKLADFFAPFFHLTSMDLDPRPTVGAKRRKQDLEEFESIFGIEETPRKKLRNVRARKRRTRGSSARVKLRKSLIARRIKLRKEFRAAKKKFNQQDKKLTRDIKSLVCRKPSNLSQDF